MSLQELKETLKPCSSFSSSFTFSASPVKLSQEFEPRRPPKSSISQQLLRLQEFECPAPLPDARAEIMGEDARVEVKQEDRGEEGEDDDEEEEEDRGRVRFGGPSSAAFQFDHTGPFEPLPLSSPGEDSLVQVPASINYRLLEHQREGVRFLYRLYKNNHGGGLGRPSKQSHF